MLVIPHHDYKLWGRAKLKDYGDFEPTFYNKREDGPDSLCGDWWYAEGRHFHIDGYVCHGVAFQHTDHGGLPWQGVIYEGTFGNDHSPGSSHNTWATVYQEDEREEYEAEVARLEAQDEYLINEDEEEEDEWDYELDEEENDE